MTGRGVEVVVSETVDWLLVSVANSCMKFCYTGREMNGHAVTRHLNVPH
jgi:hypothetical protein